MSKVAIIGSGFVGATTAFTLAVSGKVTEVVLVDVNRDKAEGDALDISHGMSLIRPVNVYSGDFKDVKGAEIVIITAGANQKPGETRLDLVRKNAEIFKDIVPKILNENDKGIYIVVTNPVDILTYITYKISGLSWGRVIGSGNVLDSSRFKYLLSKHFNIDARNIHAYIIGEHGDSEIAAWSAANIAGFSVDEFCSLSGYQCGKDFMGDMLKEVAGSAYKIIEKKGATYYAVAVAVSRIVECILRNENSILTISAPLNGEYGVSNLALSLPSIVDKDGAEKILQLPLNECEINGFRKSAEVVGNILRNMGY